MTAGTDRAETLSSPQGSIASSGVATRGKHPSDPDVPTVAAQVAASRALVDLAAQLDEIARIEFGSWENPDFFLAPLR